MTALHKKDSPGVLKNIPPTSSLKFAPSLLSEAWDKCQLSLSDILTLSHQHLLEHSPEQPDRKVKKKKRN